jgi:hypothetical protein
VDLLLPEHMQFRQEKEKDLLLAAMKKLSDRVLANGIFLFPQF